MKRKKPIEDDDNDNQPTTSSKTIRKDAAKKRQKKIKDTLNDDANQSRVTDFFGRRSFPLLPDEELFKFVDFPPKPTTTAENPPGEDTTQRVEETNRKSPSSKRKTLPPAKSSSLSPIDDEAPRKKRRFKKPLQSTRGFSLKYKHPIRRFTDKKNKRQLATSQLKINDKFKDYCARMMLLGVDVLAELNEKKIRSSTKIEKKNVGNDLCCNYVHSTVQCGLPKLFKSQAVARKYLPFIKGDVAHVSRQIRLFLLYMSCLFHENRDDPEFFNKLTCNSLRGHYKDMNEDGGKSTEFTAQCRVIGFDAKDESTNRTYIIYNALINTWKDMINTIKLNTLRAMQTYFQFVDPVRKCKKPKANRRYAEQIIAGINPNPWEYSFTAEKEGNEIRRVPMLLKIQEAVRTEQMRLEAAEESCPKGLRTHAVIPEGRNGLIHVQYDTVALVELMNQEIRAHNLKRDGYERVNPIKAFDDPKTVLNARALFSRIINFRKFEKIDRNIVSLPLELEQIMQKPDLDEEYEFNVEELLQIAQFEEENRVPPSSPHNTHREETDDHINLPPIALQKTNKQSALGATGTVKETPQKGPTKVSELRLLRKKFSCCFTTNGLEASVHFLRKDRSLTTLEIFQKCFGIDPGYKIFAAMTIVENGVLDQNGREVFKNIKCSAKSWHHLTGFEYRMKALKKMIGDVEEFIAGEREQLGCARTGRASIDHSLYVRFQLRHFELKQKTYDKSHKYLRFGWRKKMAVRRTLDRTCERLVPKGCNTAVYYGDGPMTSSTGG